jgi:transcription elongation factor
MTAATLEHPSSFDQMLQDDVQRSAQQRFIAVAKESLRTYQQTGEHITLGEFSDWAKAIKTNPKAPMPACHA